MDGGEVGGDEVELVDGCQEGDAFSAEAGEELHELGLAADIEVLGGFIEEQEAGLAGEGEGDFDALALATGELVEDAVAEDGEVSEVEGVVYGGAVLRGEASQEAQIWRSALLDYLLDGEIKG